MGKSSHHRSIIIDMAAEVKTDGKDQKTAGLDGNVKVDTNNNGIVVYDELEEVYSIIIGRCPDGTINIVIAKKGLDVYDAFD